MVRPDFIRACFGFFLAFFIQPLFSAEQTGPDFFFELSGLPLQMAWVDVNRDNQLDLVALMVETRTEGVMDTWLAEGELRGIYEDQSFREKNLLTFLQDNGTWREASRIALGTHAVLGFAVSDDGDATHLMLWRNQNLDRHQWKNNQWELERSLKTPGLLASDAAFLNDFPFWFENHDNAYWMVPDFAGIHLISLADAEHPRFIPFPDALIQDSKLNSLGHKIQFRLPRLLSLDGDDTPELLFQNGSEAFAYKLNDPDSSYHGYLDGMLADFNGDGLADLMTAEEIDVDQMKDLATIKSKVKTYLATSPFRFAEKPTANQFVPGMIMNGAADGNDGDSDFELQLSQPLLDINKDHRCDLAGIAIKLSGWQAAKVLILGTMNLKFLLSLSLQLEDGSFKEVAGGPFEMNWKLNLRRMQMPSFAELAADFDGNGWLDLFVAKETALEVTPISPAGIAQKSWSRKLPSRLRSPDQAYGRDLNGDGKASFVVIKLEKRQTTIGILERKP